MGKLSSKFSISKKIRGLTGSLVKEWRLVLIRLSIDGEVRKLEILLHNRRRNKTTTDKRAVGDLVKHKKQSRIVEPDDINSNKICLQQLRYRNFRVVCLTGTCQLQIVKKNKRVLLWSFFLADTLYTGNRKNTIVITIYSNPEERYSRTSAEPDAKLFGRQEQTWATHTSTRKLMPKWKRFPGTTQNSTWYLSFYPVLELVLQALRGKLYRAYSIFWALINSRRVRGSLSYEVLQSSKKLLKFPSLYFPQSTYE